ncbi:MAG: ComEC/Rec2 family competence protein [bacterium]|nr:ComEC/Rec2 family competence protein [bacterium]
METHQYRRTQTVLVCFFLIAVFLGNLIAWKEIWQGSSMRVSVLDIGQGDAILLQTPYGHSILMDGGPTEAIREKISERLLPWEKHIDLVILTHPDRDHIAGLSALLRYYDARNIVWTGVERATKDFETWKKTLKEEQGNGSKLYIAKASQRIHWGKDNQFLDVLHPEEDVQGKVVDRSNDTGIVSRLSFHGVSALFTADVSRAIEEKLVQEGTVISSDILKVAHHGSKYSSSPVFIQAVLPQVAAISVGKDNPYGHPTPETLATLEQYGIEVHRTDTKGDIIFTLY